MRPRSPDVAACRALLRNGSRSFHAASRLLPRDVRDSATALYAFCRVADDAIDVDASEGALDALRARLDLVYAGRPAAIVADRAFADVVARHAIPRVLPEALLDGFAWDAAGRRYADLPALEDYAARVAGTVGAMMALVMGVRAPDALARACDLGVAMQLTNVARDVGEDARNGRLYLPLAWLVEAGIDPDAWLARPHDGEALRDVVRRLLRAADAHYARAAAGVAALPRACRPAIHAARLIYAEIGREIERNGVDVVTRRAVVPASRKLGAAAAALAASMRAGPAWSAPPLPATRYLVHAVADCPPAAQPTVAEFLLGLCERLERRDRDGRVAA